MFKNVQIKLDIIFFKDDNYIVAYSPALDLSAYGTSIKDAQKSFEITFQIYLEETFTKDSLIDDLLKHGWTIQTNPIPKFIPPKTDIKALNQIYDIIKEQKRSFSFVS